MIIVMLGAPGAGKGTQAVRIAEKYQIVHISTGDIFRANIKGETELGLEAKSYMDEGKLVPDELTVRMLLDRVSQSDCSKGYVLDGFPRTIPQAQALEEELKKRSQKVDYALNIQVPDELIISRMSGRRSCPKCGAVYHIENMPPAKEGICDRCNSSLVQREDDGEETVRKRLSVYHQQTQPLIDFYRKAAVLKELDGTKAAEDVFNEIASILG